MCNTCIVLLHVFFAISCLQWLPVTPNLFLRFVQKMFLPICTILSFIQMLNISMVLHICYPNIKKCCSKLRMVNNTSTLTFMNMNGKLVSTNVSSTGCPKQLNPKAFLSLKLKKRLTPLSRQDQQPNGSPATLTLCLQFKDGTLPILCIAFVLCKISTGSLLENINTCSQITSCG